MAPVRPAASGDARTTTTEYDDTHHTFPIRITNPLDHKVETYYYGVNETTGNGSGLPGQVKATKDVDNNDTTFYQYDAFGRLLYRWLPGETTWNTGQAGEAYEYNDTPGSCTPASGTRRAAPPTWKAGSSTTAWAAHPEPGGSATCGQSDPDQPRLRRRRGLGEGDPAEY